MIVFDRIHSGFIDVKTMDNIINVKDNKTKHIKHYVAVSGICIHRCHEGGY